MSGLDLSAIDHVGYAVEDLRPAVAEFESLGFAVFMKAELGELGVEVALMASGGQKVELVRALDAAQRHERAGPRGIELDHVAYRVGDLDATVVVLRRLGAELVGPDDRSLEEPLEAAGARHIWTKLGNLRLQFIQ